MEKIDRNTWERDEIFRFFSAVSNPFYMVSFTLDVTELKTYTKRNNCSFYYSLIYLCSKALSTVENFMYVIKDGEVYKYEERIPSFTDMKPGKELFHIVSLPVRGSITKFCETASRTSREQTCFIDMSKEGDNLAYYSCVPTLRLTALTNERDFSDPNWADDNIPRIAWGKYTDNNGRLELTISMEVNHRFVDGIHIGKFAAELEKLIEELA